MVHPIITTAVAGGAGFGLGYGLGVALNMNPVSIAHFCGLNLLINQAIRYIPQNPNVFVCISIGIVFQAVIAISAVAHGVFSQPVAILFFTLGCVKIIQTFSSVIQSVVIAKIALRQHG